MSSSPLYPINPSRDIPWNALPDLPIAQSLWRTPDVLEQLGQAREALGRLHGRSVAIPNQGLLINSISLQEAKASSAIENIFTTDDELYRAFSETAAERMEGPAKEVLRYREALWSGYEYLQAGSGFTRDYFIRMFREIKQVEEGLRPPFSPTIIRQGGSGFNAGKAIYTPPRGAGILEAKLDNLVTFLNDDETYSLHPLLKMAIGHFQFEAIHPFRDGNGRTGRIFNIHYLVQKGLLDYPILYLSRYILEHKEAYYGALAGVSQRGDWPAWLLYMLRAVEATANLTFEKINRILAAREAILEVVVAQKNLRRPDQLVQKIFTQPITRVKHLTQDRTYAENTAREYLNQLVELQVLEKQTLGGNHYYLNRELYSILEE
ncbi:Fic family protein [Hymenobacter crusticola]|uniref:Cell filamentation protein Fic n=1 Tax=Hymenobacter crusticola TaxID=1770526 RepID=A0A243W7L5_9BACT|nr:Fic family protein [Hymenobacter crusticola]OUJ71014.1 cell filamentation protein Fic [Hymenobacter crusticola]